MYAIYELIEKMEWFSSFLELLLCTYFCSAFMENSRRNSKGSVIREITMAFGLAFVANGIFWSCGNSFELFYQKKIFFFVLCVIVEWIYFRRKYFVAIVASLLYGELAMVLELVAELLLSNMSLYAYQERILFLLWRILAFTLAVVLLYGLIPKTPISKVYLLVVCIVLILSLLWNWILAGTEGVLSLPEKFNDIMIPVIVIVFFLFQIVVVFFVFKMAEVHQQKQTTALIELNNKMLQKSLDETEQTFGLWRQSVHDYKNHVIALKQLADENRLDEIKRFLDKESDSVNKQLFMIRTGNSVVDTLVNLKQVLAEKYAITFLVHGIFPPKIIVEDMDLANILGNLLDNAIEASIKEKDAYVDLCIKQEKKFFLLSVRNKCTNALELEVSTSTKEHPEFHGIGLKSVKRTVNKYDGQMHMERTEKEFIVNIMIQNTQQN